MDKIPVTQNHELQGNPYLGQPDVVATLRTDTNFSRDTIATGPVAGYAPWVTRLPAWADDLQQELGCDIYERMVVDAECNSAVGVMALAVTSNEPRVIPAVGPDQDGFKIAMEIRDMHQRMVDELATPANDAFAQLVYSYLVNGHGLNENIYTISEEGKYQGALWWKDSKNKHSRDIAFLADNYMNVVGVVPQRVPGIFMSINTLTPYVDTAPGKKVKDLEGVLPRNKFTILTRYGQRNDVRGSSALRPAYSAWWIKQRVVEHMLKWVARFSEPTVWGKLGPNAIDQQKVDPAGNVIEVRAIDELLKMLETGVRAGGAIALGNGADVGLLQAQQGGDIFLRMLQWTNTEMVRAILRQHLATSEGQHQTRSSSEVHQNVLSLEIMRIKQRVAAQIRSDVFRMTTWTNFGKKYLDLAPKLDLGLGDGFPLTVEDIARLFNVGYLTDDQLATLDRLLGIPIRQKAQSLRSKLVEDAIQTGSSSSSESYRFRHTSGGM